ncbi:MAG TPA: integrase [Pseudomonas sp.]|jgi:hypothetical protein|nr:integrase [Pseudomonas sp.]
MLAQVYARGMDEESPSERRRSWAGMQSAT